MLNEAEKSEIMDLYDGSFASIRELAMLFKTNNNAIMYFVDYKGRKKKQAEATKKWQAKNLERTKEINIKAIKEYRAKHETKLKLHKKYLKRKRLTSKHL